MTYRMIGRRRRTEDDFTAMLLASGMRRIDGAWFWPTYESVSERLGGHDGRLSGHQRHDFD